MFDSYHSLVQVGGSVDAYSPFYDRHFQLRVEKRDNELDVAVLR